MPPRYVMKVTVRSAPARIPLQQAQGRTRSIIESLDAWPRAWRCTTSQRNKRARETAVPTSNLVFRQKLLPAGSTRDFLLTFFSNPPFLTYFSDILFQTRVIFFLLLIKQFIVFRNLKTGERRTTNVENR